MITIHQRHRQTDRQTERQTDRQTTCDRNTALCTKVHRAVKTLKKRENVTGIKIKKRKNVFTSMIVMSQFRCWRRDYCRERQHVGPCGPTLKSLPLLEHLLKMTLICVTCRIVSDMPVSPTASNILTILPVTKMFRHASIMIESGLLSENYVKTQ